MEKKEIVNQTSYIFAAIMLVFSFFLFYNDTHLLWKSFFAAILAAGLFWISYVLVRWLILALRK